MRISSAITLHGTKPAMIAASTTGLRAAMTVRADLALVKHVATGEGVSYGHTWIADHDTVLGLVPVGYAEGILRAAGNRATVWAEGAERPIRGRVCMDQFVIDLGARSEATAGDEVVLFGPRTETRSGPTATDWAEALDTIDYEIVTRLGGRLTRRYVDSGDPGTTTPEATR